MQGAIDGDLSGVSSQKNTDFIRSGPILMILFKPNYLLKDSSPNIATVGIKASIYEFGGHMNIQYIIASKTAESGTMEKKEQRSLC